MRRAATLFFQVKQPYPLTTRIVTQFQPLNSTQQPPNSFVIARMFLYTKDTVYRGTLQRGHLNQQLTWNQHSLQTLVESLGGKRSNIEVRFSQVNQQLVLTCQIETGIRIIMFEIRMQELKGQNSLEHMKEMVLGYRLLYLQQQNQIKKEKQIKISEIREMAALGRQIEEQTQNQMQHMKRNFVEVANLCKKQLRKHMKPAMGEVIEEEEEQTVTRRHIVKVNRQSLENARVHHDQIVQQVSEEKGFQDLWDDVD